MSDRIDAHQHAVPEEYAAIGRGNAAALFPRFAGQAPR
ncbi:hypothetical protein HMPREF9336_04071 [Segniliparus rugosus ATCC BAA-974]|uniref:Amidohydrolase n=1 Tax=Segniliparus rugosus (strain ATCC BAA-974 / DSM 45345 / CCUG 50838 / CIP 108380 / JCM 13579 / CDC 945) TaxID=679197 RepID=U1M2N7_SEGRC|nr:hypothetical protein HMPREF9336_04071 [Segniliparus rugosus ATCC BAA-974]